MSADFTGVARHPSPWYGARVTFAYTKTMAILSASQIVIRIPLTYVVDPVPFASFGIFWGGFTAALFLLVLGPILDVGTWAVWKIKGRKSR